MGRLLGSIAAAAGPAGVAALLWATAPPSASPELKQLLPISDLIQAFPALPRPQPPALWQQRLPQPLAAKLWRNKAISWFQLWGEHAGAPPYLMLPGGAELDGIPHSLRLGGYRLVAADALSLQSLQQGLEGQTVLNSAVTYWLVHHRLCFGKARPWPVGWGVGLLWLNPCAGAV